MHILWLKVGNQWLYMLCPPKLWYAPKLLTAQTRDIDLIYSAWCVIGRTILKNEQSMLNCLGLNAINNICHMVLPMLFCMGESCNICFSLILWHIISRLYCKGWETKAISNTAWKMVKYKYNVEKKRFIETAVI